LVGEFKRAGEVAERLIAIGLVPTTQPGTIGSTKRIVMKRKNRSRSQCV
jgi:hypothetical protein